MKQPVSVAPLQDHHAAFARQEADRAAAIAEQAHGDDATA